MIFSTQLLVLSTQLSSNLNIFARLRRPIGHRERKWRGGPSGDADQSLEEPDHEEPLERSGRLHQAASEAA